MLALEWKGQRKVTTAELKELLGASDGNARVVAHRLVKKGWLEPAKRGVFLVVPANRGPEGIADTNPLATGAELAPDCFYSYGTACSFHHLTEQMFMTVYLVSPKPQAPITARDTEYVFVAAAPERFFGFEIVDALGAKVRMADLERCLLDALSRPQLAGGLGEVSRIVRQAAPRLSWRRLFDYARRWNESALVQRLGYLLDIHQVTLNARTRSRLHALTRPANKIFFGPRERWGTAGKLVADWGIIENVPRDVLVEPGEEARRPLRIPPREPR
jgi:predicted transcriptional regulator of viral defense system